MTNKTSNPPENSTNNKTPQLRFKGFAGEWETQQIGSISETFSGGTPTVGISSYYGGDIPFIRSAEINSSSTQLSLTEEGLANSSAKMVEKGSILYALYGATSGEVGIAKIKGAINQAVLNINPNKDFDAYFLMLWLRSQKKNIIGTFLQGGQGNLSGSIIKSLELLTPAKKEQEKIGSFFQQLDTNLTQHQTQLEKLKNLKQAMLHKMFPQNGATEPEIRFKGFTGEWKFIQIDEICNLERGRVISKNEINNNFGKYPVYSSQTLNNGIFGYLNTFDFEGEHITWTTDGVNAGTVFYREGRFNCTNVCGVLNLKEQTYSANFIAIALNRVTYQHVSRTLANPKLMNGVMAKITFLIPSGTEQQKIANYFHKLDQLITLQTTQLKKLKQIKQAYLAGMFV